MYSLVFVMDAIYDCGRRFMLSLDYFLHGGAPPLPPLHNSVTSLS
jgi:hypothetical protein